MSPPVSSALACSVHQAFSAREVFREDRLIKDVLDRLNYVHTHIVAVLVTLPSRHYSPFQQGVLIMWVCSLLEFGIIILDHCSQQTFGRGTRRGPKVPEYLRESCWPR